MKETAWIVTVKKYQQTSTKGEWPYMYICSKCGHEVNIGSMYCRNCGRRLIG